MTKTSHRGRPGGARRRLPIAILRGKLRIPRERADWVRRGSLLNALESHREVPLILLDAPAGYGKSTTIAQWRSIDDRPFAWLSLDAAENDPVRLWTYLIEAVSLAESAVHADLIDEIRASSSLRASVVPQLLNQLAQSSRSLVVILDDYHEIHNPACHEQVSFMLENLPPAIQLVISTRADPPLGLAKLRVDSGLLELRASELRFDVDEANQLMSNVLGRRLPREQMDAIVTRAEGWPAGIYLAAVSLRDDGDVDAFLERFAGNSRLIADYLTSEALSRQPDHIRKFLTRTSILEQLTASLASTVTGYEDSAGILEQLEKTNLFVVPLDDRREWYRYHQLFRELLQSELRRLEGSRIPELHKKASLWHSDHGFIGRAVLHAIKAGDMVAARTIIWKNLLPIINAGMIESVDHWLSRLERSQIASDPILSLASGWLAGLNGRVDDVQAWLSAAMRGAVEGPLPDGTSSLASAIALLRAMYGNVGVSESLESAREAVEAEAGSTSAWLPVAEFTYGFYLHTSGFLVEARDALEDARNRSHPEQPVVEAVSAAELSMVASDQNDRPRAKALAYQALGVMEEYSLLELPQASFVHTALGRVLADEGDLEGGAFHLERALTLRNSRAQMSRWPTIQSMIALAPVRFACGDRENARELVRRAAAIVDFEHDAGVFRDEVRRLQRSLGPSRRRPAIFGETLTDRELSVLRFLDTPLTHREIGDALFISQNTVKSHARSLYMKLSASSREEAVHRARELGLL